MKQYAKGAKVQALEDKPELSQDLLEVWDCFTQLHNCRANNGFGASPLSLQDIVSYFDLIDLDDHELRLLYFRYIKFLDLNWLKMVTNANATNSSGRPPSSR